MSKPNTRPLESISVQGYVIPAGGSVLLKPCKKTKSIKDGFLRVHNVSNESQTLMPSKKAQEQWPEFSPEIQGDNKLASMPMAWNNPLIRFEIIALPNSILPTGDRELLEPEKWTRRGSTWTMKELVSAVAAPAGSEPPGPDNPKNYMGYDRTNWQVFRQNTQQGQISGVDIIVAHGRLKDNYETKDDELAYIFETLGRKIAFVVCVRPASAYMLPQDNLRHFLDKIGTAGCISLLQKAIRRRPEAMQHPETGEQWPTQEIVLRIAQRHLRGVQPGFFLPNVGKFVSGFQHFLKRLFIIAAEDSEYDPNVMFDISTLALLASLQPVWTPSEAVINRFVGVTLRLLMSSQTSHYDTSQDWPMIANFQTAVPALVQAEMGGMSGDQRMLRWLAANPQDRNRIGAVDQPLVPQVDPLDVYCDQHQDGRLACLLENTDTIPSILSSAFVAVSGFNTRRYPVAARTREQQMVFDGLRASSKLLRGIIKSKPVTSGPDFSYTLADGALAGMVGTIEISDKGKYYVTVSARDISKFVVIPKPTRDNKRGLQDITPAKRDAILVKAFVKLEQGVSVTNPVAPAFRGKKIRYQTTQWFIDGRPWSEQKQQVYRLSVAPDWTKLTALTTASVSWSKTFGAGRTFTAEARQFALGRMAGYSPWITIPKINRVGQGTDEALSGLEVEAYQYIEYLTEFFPDALWPSSQKAFAFESASVAFRRCLCEKLRDTIVMQCDWPTWTSAKTLKFEQRQGVDEMLAQHAKGLSSFLWMLVGQGKTLTVLRYLEETRAAKNILWSLPKSAVGSVADQISEVGWRPVQLYPSRGLFRQHKKKNLPATTHTELTGSHVYLIEHDHLRRVTDKLAGQMSQTAFVFDEVHKAMQSGTKRTASALRLARIAKQLVALTGTPIVDKSGYGLMQWLRLCVPFQVSASNLWVAMNSMVSPLNTGDVITEDLVIEVDESAADKVFFNTNFPRRRPWYGQTDVPTSVQWRDMRLRTNEIVTNELVRMTAALVQRHTENWRSEHRAACVREKSPGNHWHSNSQRPLVVASDSGHAVQIVNKLLQAGVSPGDILCVGGAKPTALAATVRHAKTIHLTEQAVMTGEEPPYKVVVAALRYCEGYSLTWMTCLLTGAYPSNQASRTQMRGRINRLDAQRLYKRYYTVLAGVTTITYRYQEAAKLMEDALRQTSTTRSAKKKKQTRKMFEGLKLTF